MLLDFGGVLAVFSSQLPLNELATGFQLLVLALIDCFFMPELGVVGCCLKVGVLSLKEGNNKSNQT